MCVSVCVYNCVGVYECCGMYECCVCGTYVCVSIRVSKCVVCGYVNVLICVCVCVYI